MMRLGYDNEKYIRTQSAHIRERISQFGGKLYLEFGGKLYEKIRESSRETTQTEERMGAATASTPPRAYT